MKRNSPSILAILFIALSLWLAACQTAAEPTPVAQVQEPAVVDTPAPEPTAIIAATDTPMAEVTATAEPTTAPTVEPAVEPTVEPTPGPVELVLSITGDPHPLNDPSGMALDAQGNLYVADTLNHRIQVFDSEGNFLITWGSEGSGDGQFNFIYGDPAHNLAVGGVAVDGEGNVYVADGGNARIQKFDSNGNFLTTWGSSGNGDGQFIRPADLTVDRQGNVYVIDDRSLPPRIQKFDTDGNFLARFAEDLLGDPGLIVADEEGNIYVTDVANGTILKLDGNGSLIATFGGEGTADGQLSGPLGIDLDSEGNLYVVDSGNGRIQKLDNNGNFLFKWGRFRDPYGIRIDSEGNIYISDYVNDRIQKYRLTTPPTALEPVEFVWSMTGDPNPLDTPAAIALDAQGDLYVVDGGNNRIQVFDSEGQFISAWGSTGDGEGEFNFLRANGDIIGAIALDPDGNVFVADNANRRIQKFDSQGGFLLQWGTPGPGEGEFLSPVGLAVDQEGNVYVSDDGRDDVQKFDNDGRFLLRWGGPGNDDGQFNFLGGLDVDSQGNVYVADFSNHRVQKFDSDGNFLAKWGTRGQGPGQFNDPGDIAVDGRDNVFVVEFAAHSPDNYRVQAFDSDGNFLMQWGSPGEGDGQFIHPFSIAADDQGNVYVSDETNRIQKFRIVAGV
jgi:DNA-binding beta-propeller fold protein YncE